MDSKGFNVIQVNSTRFDSRESKRCSSTITPFLEWNGLAEHQKRRLLPSIVNEITSMDMSTWAR